MEDLIQNAHTLFDEPISPSSLPSDHTHGPRNSMISYSSLFESSLFAEPHIISPEGSSARSSSSIFPSDYSPNLSIPPRLPPSLFLSPLLGLSPSQTLTDGTDSPEPEEVIPQVTKSSHTSPPLTSASTQQLPQQRPHIQISTVPHSPPTSLPSSSAFHPASSATSLQSELRTFSPFV